MAFNSADIGAFKNIWVYCEQRQGKLMPTNFELMSEARRLADERGCELIGILVGSDVEGLAKEMGGYGADKVIVLDDPALELYTTDAYTKAICDCAMELKPEIILLGATNIGRDLGPRCAARLQTGLTADCTHLDIDMDVYREFLSTASTLDLTAKKFTDPNPDQVAGLKTTRPAFGGHLMATIICPRFRPYMSTVRPGVMEKKPFDQAKADACVVEKFPVNITEADLKTKVVDIVKSTKKRVDLIGADVIVSVGRGIHKDIEGGIKLAEELTEAFGGGVVGGSRVTIDSGWLSKDHQVGQTGTTVHPKVYVALGISGSIQHKAGMQESELIIAVNKDENAPIFEIADYGICGDLFKVTPLLIEALNEARANK